MRPFATGSLFSRYQNKHIPSHRLWILLLGTFATGLLMLPPSAYAVPDDPWDAIQAGAAPNDQISFNLRLLENSVSSPGEENFGIAQVTNIKNVSQHTTIWDIAGSTRSLNGFFTGSILQTFDPSGTNTFSFTGGHFELYDRPNGQFQPTGPADRSLPNGLLNQVCQVSTGPCTPWLILDFTDGIASSVPGADLKATIAGYFTGSTTAIGFGFLNITGGDHNVVDHLSTHTFGGGVRNLYVDSTLSACEDPDCGTWPVINNNQVDGFFQGTNTSTATVPEPSSLLLLGPGLAGLGFWHARMKNAA